MVAITPAMPLANTIAFSVPSKAAILAANTCTTIPLLPVMSLVQIQNLMETEWSLCCISPYTLWNLFFGAGNQGSTFSYVTMILIWNNCRRQPVVVFLFALLCVAREHPHQKRL
jgi:hypothetical protein